MGVYIKGMEMPTRCADCPMCYDYIRCRLEGKDFGEIDCLEIRADWCPLIELQPHGRLIDADALDTEILQAGFSYALTRRKLRYTPGDVRQKIANAPTIIEAEEEES